ncbi:MAG TPA: prepilin-type N-terminal cleavage/methylation domain-containing protein [Synergistaceae bacterium]|nr:prepilin-type N-terminal cleavage/methylation domain-containing protein [Synergistaceae bacterium]HPJ24893.1 prepilin-type N-terminal cleavage/methylation domain-containing protein [Synergistaceae bacterium]HPQ36988.1 prepilin-type N-terminal cleavage/methylation domain-containing protein [Synergistaceae bacterium]
MPRRRKRIGVVGGAWEKLLPPFRDFSAKKPGLSLVEVLVVLVILGIMAATLGVLFSSSWIVSTSPEGAVRHAEKLASWLDGKILESRLQGEGFRLILPSTYLGESLRLFWNSRSLVDTWKGEGYFIRVPEVPESRFSLPLGTFTPTFTLGVYREEDLSSLPDATVTVSLYGKITVLDMVP